MDSVLEDEIISINSIYEENTLKITNIDDRRYTLKLPTEPLVILRLHFPNQYPDEPPRVLGTDTLGAEVPKGMGIQIVELANQALSEVYQQGLPCVYDLISELVPLVEHQLDVIASHIDVIDQSPPQQQHQHNPIEDMQPPPPWFIGEAVTEKKSSFLARCVAVDSAQQVAQFTKHLLLTDKKCARATHNIRAWRLKGSGPDGELGAVQDCDDDGETAAGGRLLHLLQVMKVSNVLVIVSRWYGGVKLGPDRFRVINNTARDVLVMSGYLNDDGDKRAR